MSCVLLSTTSQLEPRSPGSRGLVFLGAGWVAGYMDDGEKEGGGRSCLGDRGVGESAEPSRESNSLRESGESSDS